MATVDKYLSQLTFNVVAATAISEGDLVGLDTAGTLRLADADGVGDATSSFRALGVAVRGGASGATIAVAPIAVVSGLSSLTRGAAVFLSATAGGYTATQPTTNTHTVQFVGIALSTSSVAVNIGTALKYVTSAQTVGFLAT